MKSIIYYPAWAVLYGTRFMLSSFRVGGSPARKDGKRMRLFILTLSMGCVVLYGYALAGYAGYWFDKGRPDYIAGGLILGTLCGGAALYLWKKNLHHFFMDVEEMDLETEERNDDPKNAN